MLDTAHSRFPVIGRDKDDVLGILLAKDLLRYFADRTPLTCATACARRCSSPNPNA